METTHGFELVREKQIEEYRTRARIYRHVRSGALLLSMENDDENKVFGVNFRTPPADSTGLPHILEHSVLGGSHKYPLKEPFVQLVKGSLKTFLNAMTYPDRTVYPVASQNLQDFYNLVDVYIDAVFHPLITRQHLEQEGWHYELENADAPLIYKGVVFNEMKGAYSSPDARLYRASQHTLFPDNAYANDSGGDPRVIPQLTYEQFTDFYRTYYHPSNALIYFYGDDPAEERLRLLDATLREYEATAVEADVALQPPFAAPRRVMDTYGVNAQTDADKKGMAQVNWLLPEGTDTTLVMGLSLLSYALIGTQASPLYKALLDSGLGEAVTGGGLSTTLRQMTFSAGLKGIAPDNGDQVEALILETLGNLAESGIEPEMVEAAYNSIEFSLRENNTGSTPRGLSLMMRAVRGWIYGGDPISFIGFEAPLAAVRTHLDRDPDYLTGMIRRYLVENPHRVTVILTPDAEQNQRLEAEERAELDAVRAGMDARALDAVIANTASLRARQEAQDSPEELAKLPMLTLGDLDRQVKTIPIEVSEIAGGRLLYHDLFTNGIVYLDVGFDLRAVPGELLPYARLFAQSLVEMGTETEDYVKLSQRIGRKTGGVWPSTFLSSLREDPEGSAWLFLHGKATMTQAPELLAILRDILSGVRLDNRDRLRQIVLKSKAGKESSLVPGGSGVVEERLRAGFSKAAWAREQMSGINHLFFLRELIPALEQDWPGVLAKLEAVRQALVNRNALLVNVTLDAANWTRFAPQLEEFAAALPGHAVTRPVWTPSLGDGNEGLTIPAQVNYVGKAANVYDLGYRLHGSINVITNFLRTSWLWDKVRAQGGAYGAYLRFSQQSGVLAYLSYRDPNLLGTLDVYDRSAQFLRQTELDEGELTKSIIGAIGTLDAYQLPDAKGYSSMVRYLLGESDEDRQRFRDQLLGTTAADFLAFADVLDAVAQQGRVVVMGSQEAVSVAEQTRPGWLKIQRVL